MTRSEACLILNMIDHIGPVTVRRLTQTFGSPEAILNASIADLKSVPGVGIKSAKAISEWRSTLSLENELKEIERLGLRVITQEDENYPVHLKQIHDPPLVLYVKGSPELRLKNSLAIVGMRHPTHYGQEVARKFGYQFGSIGVPVVSGLALGVDAAAHRGCLQGKGYTVAVLGFGFGYLEKAENALLSEEILENGGSVITEFPCARNPDRQTFPMRNRIVSGMTLGTLVVEAGVQSGALITANFALEQGRQVFAIPGRIHSPSSQGCHKLIQNGAKLVQSIEDVLEEFEYLIPRSKKSEENPSSEPSSFIKLTETEQKVWSAISDEETEIDLITESSNLPASIVSATLLVLEMKRMVRQLPGKRYVRSLQEKS